MEGDVNLSMNCALLTWNTNRHISAKEPLTYLRERVEGAALSDAQIRQRLESHLIPFDELNVGGYSEIVAGYARSRVVKSDYERFISTRARAVHQVAINLCAGQDNPFAEIET